VGAPIHTMRKRPYLTVAMPMQIVAWCTHEHATSPGAHTTFSNLNEAKA